MTFINALKKSQNEQGKGQAADAAPEQTRRVVRPRYQVQERETHFSVQIDLPGVSKESVDISLAEGLLEMRARRSWSDRAAWRPLAGASEDEVEYRLQLALGDEVDGEKITASLESGVLQLSLAKAEDKKPRRIAIN